MWCVKFVYIIVSFDEFVLLEGKDVMLCIENIKINRNGEEIKGSC